MKLTKEAEKVYNQLKAEGYTDEEIADGYVFPVERTPEEEAQWAKELNEHRKKIWDAMSDEQKREINEYAEKLRKEDEASTKGN